MATILKFPKPEPIDDETDALVTDLERVWVRQRRLAMFMTGMSVGAYIGLWVFGIVALVRYFHG